MAKSSTLTREIKERQGKEARAIEKARGKLPKNALIIDKERGWYLDHVEASQISNPTGRMWRFGNNIVYSLELTRTRGETENSNEIPIAIEALQPFEPSAKIDTLPDKGYRALFWKEAEILFAISNTLLEKLGLIGMYVLIGILLFVAYLLVSSMGGK